MTWWEIVGIVFLVFVVIDCIAYVFCGGGTINTQPHEGY